MSLKEQIVNIGKEANISLGGLVVTVIIQDYKNSYGKDRWLVTPVSGSGEIWVESIKLKEVKEEWTQEDEDKLAQHLASGALIKAKAQNLNRSILG